MAEDKIKDEWVDYIHQLQNKICTALEEVDGKAKFLEDEWQREEGGGGQTKIIENGNVFEKGGVNTSVVFGNVTDAMRSILRLPPTGGIEGGWFAAGISLVMHPVNPFVPTVHCNYRMFELYNEDGSLADRWFGGGADLTPYYLFEEDAKHFHQTYKNVCDEFDAGFYPLFKKNCDDYFVNTHRNNERRGIGGIFYEALSNSPYRGEPNAHNQLIQNAANNTTTKKSRAGAQSSPSPGEPEGAFWFSFAKACGNAFTDAYISIVQKRKNILYTDAHKHWQEIRRGRYVEFNLIHDKGTLFGLKTNGRTESILMSLPPTVRFEYNYQPQPDSEEDKLLQVCLKPRDWVFQP